MQLDAAATPGKATRLHFITLFLKNYVYVSSRDTFVPGPAMPMQLPSQICKALDDLQAINQGVASLRTCFLLEDLFCDWLLVTCTLERARGSQSMFWQSCAGMQCLICFTDYFLSYVSLYCLHHVKSCKNACCSSRKYEQHIDGETVMLK